MAPIRISTVAACLLGLAACRTPYTEPDYTRTQDEIRSSTGAEHVFHPSGEAEATQRRVAELLADGLALSEAVELGMLNNPALQAAFHSIGMAHADRVQAGLLANPSLSLGVRFPTSGGAPEWEAGLFAGLLDLWQVPKRERVAESALRRRVLEVAYQATQLAGAIRVAYIESTSTQRLVDIAKQNRESARKLHELASARLDAAAGTVIEANLARIDLLDTEIALGDAKLAAQDARLDLLLELGFGPHESRLRTMGTAAAVRPTLPSATQLEDLAMVRRLDIRAAEEAVLQAEAEVDRQRGLARQNFDVGVAAERDGDWSLGPGLQLDLPLFDRNQAQVAKAIEALALRQATLQASRLAVAREVSSALARTEGSWDALAIYRNDLLPYSEEALAKAHESYQLGKTTILPALEAQRQLLAARSDYARRLLRAATALSDLESATGTPRELLFAHPVTTTRSHHED